MHTQVMWCRYFLCVLLVVNFLVKEVGESPRLLQLKWDYVSCMYKEDKSYPNEEKSPVLMYDRLLNLASSALAEVCFITFKVHMYINTCLSDTWLDIFLKHLEPWLCYRKNSGKIHWISGKSHIGMHLYGNPVQIEKVQKL